MVSRRLFREAKKFAAYCEIEIEILSKIFPEEIHMFIIEHLRNA